jgi:hypothetical protein
LIAQNRHLNGNGLVGLIVPEVFLKLTNLVELHLMSNKLEGVLPKEISNLAALQSFTVQSNPEFGGTIPAEIGVLVALTNL